MKSQDLFRCERGDLASGDSVDWLYPQIIYSAFANRIGHALSVWAEAQATTGDSLIGIEQARRLCSREVQQRDLIYGVWIFWSGNGRDHVSQGFPVGRKSKTGSRR